MTNFTQMAGLAVQNFVSAAVGIAVLIAVVRGFARRDGSRLGNFWYDLTRTMLYVLLPVSIIGALFLVSQGVIQSFGGTDTCTTLAGGTQTLAFGPGRLAGDHQGARDERRRLLQRQRRDAVREPDGLSNFVEMLSDPAASRPGSPATFGRMVGSRRQGWAIYAAMLSLFVAGVVVVYAAESTARPPHARAHGLVGGGTWRARSSASGSLLGAVRGGHDRRLLRRGQRRDGVADRARRRRPVRATSSTGEVVFGGVGSGLYGMLLFVLLAVFLAGPDGRPHARVPGQEDRARARSSSSSLGDARRPAARARLHARSRSRRSTASRRSSTRGPQGFTESLYAYISQANNNGSAFAGYTGFLQPNAGNVGALRHHVRQPARRRWRCCSARFLPMLVALAVAGALAGKRSRRRARARCAPTRRRSSSC